MMHANYCSALKFPSFAYLKEQTPKHSEADRRLVLLSFLSLLVRWAFEVRVIEEEREEQKVAEVHGGAEDDVVHGGHAVNVVFPAEDEHQNAEPCEHLQHLHQRD